MGEKCKHNRLKNTLQNKAKFGDQTAYCHQCQKMVDVFVPKPRREEEGVGENETNENGSDNGEHETDEETG